MYLRHTYTPCHQDLSYLPFPENVASFLLVLRMNSSANPTAEGGGVHPETRMLEDMRVAPGTTHRGS